jgi:high affinity Mn2+ porin
MAARTSIGQAIPDEQPAETSGQPARRSASDLNLEQKGGKNPSQEDVFTAEDTGAEGAKAARPAWYSIFGQATYVGQGNWKFRSPYEGPNSLLPILNYRSTETTTLFLDVRPWTGAEIVFNPDVAGGVGLSSTTGLADFPNGEATRVGIPEPTPYFARVLLRQTFSLDGDTEILESAPI